jgi:hypothetical protein
LVYVIVLSNLRSIEKKTLEKIEGAKKIWTIQRNWQHWVHRILDEDKQNNTKQKTQKTHRKLKKMSNTRLNKKPGSNPKDKQFMSLMLLL